MVFSKARFADWTAASWDTGQQLQSAGHLVQSALQVATGSAHPAPALQPQAIASAGAIESGDCDDGPPVTIENIADSRDPHTWLLVHQADAQHVVGHDSYDTSTHDNAKTHRATHGQPAN